MKHHEFTFRSLGILENTEKEELAIDDINSVSKLCPQRAQEIEKPENITSKVSAEIQTNKTHLAKGISIIRSHEADFIENPRERFVISNALSIETYRKGNLHEIGISFETERNISETYYESEEVPENERFAQTESVGSQTSTSFTSKARKLHVKTAAQLQEVQVTKQIEKKQNPNVIQTLGDLNNTLDDLHRSLNVAKTHLKAPKYDTFGTQTTLGTIEYLVASDDSEEDDDEGGSASNIYIRTPRFTELLA